MGLQGQSWILNVIRTIFCFFDVLIYGLIKWILFGIFDLSSLTTNSDVFSGIYQRIYVVLGIFMAFKLSFSFFQYIIDPDSMGAKSEKGVSKLFMRVFMMLFALMVLPSILFGHNGGDGLLSRAQNAFLPVLPRLIFGQDDFVGTNNITQTVEQTSEELAVTTLKGFFAPPEDLDSVCGTGTLSKTPEIKSIGEFQKNVNLTCDAKGTGVAGIGAKKYYKYSYLLFISTIVGGLIAVLLLAITLDIAKRIFKLIILEIIAPVPIMSLIDPKGAKDGAFSKWIHSLITTFTDIFIKLGLVYLIIVLIHMIVGANGQGGIFTNFPTFQQNGFRATYLTICLILGLIFFAKEAPKFIKDALGIKGEGGGLFDDVKTLGKAAGLVGGAAGIVGSGIASARANYLADETNGKSHHPGRILKNIGAGFLGAGAGAGTALRASLAKDAKMGSALKAQSERNARILARGASGSTWLGRRGSELSNMFTGQTEASRLERELAANEAKQGIIKNITDRAKTEMPKSLVTMGTLGKRRDGSSMFDRAGNNISGAKFNYKEMMAQYEAAKARGLEYVTVQDSSGTSHDIRIGDVAFGQGNLLKENEADYLEKANNSKYMHKDARGNDVYDIEDATLGSYMADGTRSGFDGGMVRSRGALKAEESKLSADTSSKKLRQSKAKANDRYSATKK